MSNSYVHHIEPKEIIAPCVEKLSEKGKPESAKRLQESVVLYQSACLEVWEAEARKEANLEQRSRQESGHNVPGSPHDIPDDHPQLVLQREESTIRALVLEALGNQANAELACDSFVEAVEKRAKLNAKSHLRHG